MSIEASNIRKSFGSFTALGGVDLRVRPGKLVALLGPSGSGKTSLLRIIAGLEHADPGSGRILFHGEDVTDVPAGQRKVGFVFQHYALFRHMSVFENIAFGLRVRKRRERPPEPVIIERVNHLLELVQLGNLGLRYPSQLSGGQRQRVALARALAVEPKVLLLDEPFGALDAKVRKELRRWLRRFHREIRLTTVFVTHDQEEALEVADEVVIMNHGRIEQVGSPQEIYEKPASPFVHEFLGLEDEDLLRLRQRQAQAADRDYAI
jgi:sulfate transport system ATP-binding protein